MAQRAHRTGMQCLNCPKQLIGLFYYNLKEGGLDKLLNHFYCSECKKVYYVTIKEVEA